MSYPQELQRWFATHLPVYSRGIAEAREIDPQRFDRLCQTFLEWTSSYLGPDHLEVICRSYAQFTTSVNIHQARYELTGKYEAVTVQEFQDELYAQDDRMEEYLWGVFLTTFLWPHHLVLAGFYEDVFLPHLAPNSKIVELAFGHGGWGLWALSQTDNTSLVGIDIAASSVQIASGLARAAKLEQRAHYQQGDALSPASEPTFDAGICGFVVEHLEQPQLLFESLASRIYPGGHLFLTGALTAAQEDHIFEFVRESELLIMAEDAGFRVLATSSQGPARTLPKAKYLPRSMALHLQRRTGKFF